MSYTGFEAIKPIENLAYVFRRDTYPFITYTDNYLGAGNSGCENNSCARI